MLFSCLVGYFSFLWSIKGEASGFAFLFFSFVYILSSIFAGTRLFLFPEKKLAGKLLIHLALILLPVIIVVLSVPMCIYSVNTLWHQLFVMNMHPDIELYFSSLLIVILYILVLLLFLINFIKTNIMYANKIMALIYFDIAVFVLELLVMIVIYQYEFKYGIVLMVANLTLFCTLILLGVSAFRGKHSFFGFPDKNEVK